MECPFYGELKCTGALCGKWSPADGQCSYVSAAKHQKEFVKHLKQSSEHLKVIASKTYLVDC